MGASPEAGFMIRFKGWSDNLSAHINNNEPFKNGTSDSSLKNSWAAHGPGNSNRLEIVFEELFWSKRLFADKIRSERTNFTEI